MGYVDVLRQEAAERASSPEGIEQFLTAVSRRFAPTYAAYHLQDPALADYRYKLNWYIATKIQLHRLRKTGDYIFPSLTYMRKESDLVAEVERWKKAKDEALNALLR